jgi:hypothetical protein
VQDFYLPYKKQAELRMELNVNKQGYPYAWLDEVIEVILNPEKTNVTALQINELELIENKFDQELREVLKVLKASTFYLFSSKKIRATVTQYYDSLLILERQALDNLANYPTDHPLIAVGENLIVYIQNTRAAFTKRYGEYIIDITRSPASAENIVIKHKVLCKLSVDQLGIILKAADDTKLIIATSLSVIFRSLVPFLSTGKSKNISWSSMRKSTYHMETADKEIAIAALEALILKIKDF